MTAPPADVAPVRPGEELNWGNLERYLRAQLPEIGVEVDGEFRVLQFPNGSANLTYFVQIGDRPLVVRRPPFGVIAPGAHDMKREYRALSRLWEHFDRAPRGYLFCNDHDVIGSDFLVIEYRHGTVIWGVIPESMAHHADAGRRVGFALIDTLADLHALDPVACGVGDLGKPDGFVQRQVAGWKKRWELASPPGAEPLMDDVAGRLAASMPESPRPSVLHNDYKLDNCQFDPANPDRVKSIFDWDMATLGDPFIDLGTLMNYWPDPSATPDSRPQTQPGADSLGLPARNEVVERYAARTGLDVSHVDWYEAFAAWKTAVVLQQLYTRYVRGESSDERMASRGENIGIQCRRAASILGL